MLSGMATQLGLATMPSMRRERGRVDLGDDQRDGRIHAVTRSTCRWRRHPHRQPGAHGAATSRRRPRRRRCRRRAARRRLSSRTSTSPRCVRDMPCPRSARSRRAAAPTPGTRARRGCAPACPRRRRSHRRRRRPARQTAPGRARYAGPPAPLPRGFLLLPGELADRLAPREVDSSSVVDLDHLDHDLVADVDDVLDLVDMVLGELADPDQALLLRHDLDEGAEAHEARHLALVDPADLDVVGEVVDHRHRLLARRGVGRCDEHAAVVLDVDLRSRSPRRSCGSSCRLGR